MQTFEDALWRYYGYPNPYWANKCLVCREKVMKSKKPVIECINCWKIELWSKSFVLAGVLEDERQMGENDIEEVFCNPLERFMEDRRLSGCGWVAKASIKPVIVVRSGIPVCSYTEGETDYLLMFYASTILERDELRDLLCRVMGLRQDMAGRIPVRRGCWMYDDILGPWMTWFDPEKDA